MTAPIWGMGVLITFAALMPAQERPTFQTGVAEVHVDAGVFDPNGGPVTGLVKTDFRVFDEGEEQMLTGFAAEEQELDLILLFDASGSMHNGCAANWRSGLPFHSPNSRRRAHGAGIS